MNRQRYLLVVSGPAGVGKDTVVDRLIKTHPGIELSVSATTRAPRAGEVDGVHYHFMKKEQFLAHVAAGELLEHACYAGNYYGTLKAEVENRMEKGITCVLVIEVKGAANVKRAYPGCTTVFILPPDMQTLENRLHGRGSETPEKLAERMAIALDELALANSYDYQLVNDQFEICAEELYGILRERQAEEQAAEE